MRDTATDDTRDTRNSLLVNSNEGTRWSGLALPPSSWHPFESPRTTWATDNATDDEYDDPKNIIHIIHIINFSIKRNQA